MSNFKEKLLQSYRARICSVILAVIIFFVSLFGLLKSGDKNGDKSEEINWSAIRLSSVLPEPEGTKGKVYSDTESNMRVSLYDISAVKYRSYITACRDRGFTIDPEETDSSYKSFNKQGYKLEINYYDSELFVAVDEPIKFTSAEWPDNPAGRLLPEPASEKRYVPYSVDDGFYIFVGDMPMGEYNNYVAACMERGFTADCIRTDTGFSAKNADGYTVTLQYEGFNTVSINILSSPSGGRSPD